MLRFLFLLFLIYVAIKTGLYFGKAVLRYLRSSPPDDLLGTRGVNDLARDPVCGMYVPVAGSPSLSDGSTVRYFCSEACRKKYQAGLR